MTDDVERPIKIEARLLPTLGPYQFSSMRAEMIIDRGEISGNYRWELRTGASVGSDTGLRFAEIIKQLSKLTALRAELARVREETIELRADARKLSEALAFYADPHSYLAIGFIADPPCGEFAEDVSETEFGDRPGKLAREITEAVFYVACDECETPFNIRADKESVRDMPEPDCTEVICAKCRSLKSKGPGQ